jgi:hypothetical protein
VADYTDQDETGSAEERLLKKAKRCFRLATEAEQKQRERERDDLRFQVPEYQWDEGAKRQRMGLTIDNVPTPARPILSIPKLDQPVQLVLNQERAAHLGVNIHPLNEEADEDTAEVLQGLYRRIERDSQAGNARSWAFERAVKCGRGAYMVNTRFDEESGDSSDQVITIERILHQDSVYFDPAAEKADFSDGEWAFRVGWVPIEKFKREWPDASVASADELIWANLMTQEPEWVKGEGEARACLVAWYFYKVHESVKGKGQRERDKVSVKWCKLTGFEVLEEGDWNGKYIPLIPVIGRELQPFDSERRWVGVIGPAKDSQRLYNYAASTAVEIAALEPKAPWLMVEGQDEGYEQEWQQSNTRNLPILHYRAKSVFGEPAPPPQRVQIDANRLGASMELLQQADQFIQAATAVFDPSLGRLNQKERSGKAIQALQSQGDAGNSNYLDNLAEISLALESRVVLDLIPAIYDRPGRIARIMDAEDKSTTVMFNKHYFEHPQSGRPVGMPPGPNGAPPVPPAQPGGVVPKVKFYDLRKGIYTVSVTIGKSYQTRLEAGGEMIGEFLQSAPQLMPIIGPLWLKYQDWPGAREMSDLLAKIRDKQMPGLTADENQPSPEQLQAQIQQMQQGMQLTQAQLQAAMQEIKTEQAKQQALIMKAQIEADKDLKLQAMKDAALIAAAKIKAGMQQDEARDEAIALASEQGADAAAQAAEHDHERGMAHFQAAHGVASAAQQPPPEGPQPPEIQQPEEPQPEQGGP